MATAGTDGTGLEELLLVVLRSGTPLADGLRKQLNKLSIWLMQEFAGEPQGRKLTIALIQLQDRGETPAPGVFLVEENDSPVSAHPGTAGDADAGGDGDAEDTTGAGGSCTGGAVDDVTGAGGPGIDGAAAGASADSSSADSSSADSSSADSSSADADAADAAGAKDAGAAGKQAQPDAAETAVQQLRQLWAALRADPVARQYRSVYGEPPEIDAAPAVRWLWRRLFLTCLRLPGTRADEIRQHAKAAVADYPDAEQLPELVPEGLPEGSETGLGELRELVPALSRWPGLAKDATWLNWLAWHDEGVKCAHRDTNTQGIAVFNETLRQRFTKNTADKLAQLCRAVPDLQQEAYQLVQVDEVLRGVVPIPLPEEGSWWMACLEQSRQRLESHPGNGSRVKVLPLDLESPTEWEHNFSSKDVVLIGADETVGGHDKRGKRVWILRYPAMSAGTSEWQKGRFIAVR